MYIGLAHVLLYYTDGCEYIWLTHAKDNIELNRT